MSVADFPATSVPIVAPEAPSPVRFVGERRVYRRIIARGAVALMFTLGLYRFWLATDTRRFLWANAVIDGDGLEYIGTARELLVGFLMALALMVPVYVAFFLAALEYSVFGRWSTVLGFLVLALFGQYAIFRARRYRLSRTVLRGLRFHQTGSAVRYAITAFLWWGVVIATFGLAYPFAQANLERYKMRHTHYGTLTGRFAGSGFRLLLRGLLLWLIVVGPMLAALLMAAALMDWGMLALAMTAGRSTAVLANEQVSAAIGLTMIGLAWGALAALIFYPLFQAITLRWWLDGIRIGPVTAHAQLRTRRVYGIYLRFLWFAFLFSILASLLVFTALGVFGLVIENEARSQAAELFGVGALLATYVVIALMFSTLYQMTVKYRLWVLSFESVVLTSVAALAHVEARGAAGSPFGEGLADVLNVGGL